MLEGAERLFIIPYSLAVGRPPHGFLPRLLAVRQSPLPRFAAQSVVRQAFDLLGRVVPGERLKRFDDLCMECPPPLQEETAVGHLVGQGVFEGIDPFRNEVRLVEELSAWRCESSVAYYRLGHLGNALEQRQGDLGTDHRGRLEQSLLFWWQPIDTGGQHRMHGVWDAQRECTPPLFDNRLANSSRKNGFPSAFVRIAYSSAAGRWARGTSACTTQRLSRDDSGGSAICVAYDLSSQAGRYPGR